MPVSKLNKQAVFVKIPPVNEILKHKSLQIYVSEISHEFIVATIQRETNYFRELMLAEKSAQDLSRDAILQELANRSAAKIAASLESSLKKVINATGIILHTGLGRAPLAEDAAKNLMKICEGYCNLEIDLATGKRGKRNEHIEELLCFLTGAEAACVVNNNAAAVLLVLNTLAFGKETIISRGQLIEIGGSFRIPEVMEKSGTRMVEVGTTNKTHLRDYAKAISENTGLICLVHPSNYRVQGFTDEAHLSEVAKLARKHELPIVQDLGGGVLLDLRDYELPYEPIARESLQQGADVVTFSGDKVLGGPQCGIIVGKRKFIGEIQANPLMRALRCDKLIYAALDATLKLYLQEETLRKRNKIFKMLLEPVSNLEVRAKQLESKISKAVKSICQIEIENTVVQVGSGALPLENLPSKALSLQPRNISVEVLARNFRFHTPPIIGYIRDDKLIFDLRTVFEEEENILMSAINTIVSQER